MPGRHASAEHAAAPWGRILAISVATVAVLVAGAFGVRALLDARGDACDASHQVDVAADPAIAEVLTELAQTYQESAHDAGDDCVAVNVAGVPGSDAAAQMDGDATPDLWIPDSGMWSQRLDEPSTVETLGHVASTPLVIVARRADADEIGWPDGDFSWRSLLGGDEAPPARVANPGSTSEGLASMLVVRASLGDADQVEQVGALATLARVTVPTVNDAYGQLSSDDSPAPVFPATEQSVIAHNQQADGDGVVAIYPEEGTVAFDYPALATPATRAAEETQRIVSGFVEFLGTEEAVQRVQEAGFRSPEGQPAESAGVTDGTQPGMPDLLEEPEPEAVGQLAEQWTALSREMRMLTVIDVSGSMNEDVPSGGSRIEVTRDAALDAIDLLPPNSEVGLWVFSILLDPPDHHHAELAPVGPLDEQVEGGTHYDELTEALESLPERVEGGTALYDTALEAFRHMSESYDPDRVNSVVLMTDGRDEDNPASIGLEPLLEILGEEFDPEAPVPIITIGFGPDADMDALEQISEATGTTAFQAEDPDDIQDVFVRAMIERQCRPNC